MGHTASRTRYATKGISGDAGTENGRNWLVVGAIVIIVAVIAAPMLL